MENPSIASTGSRPSSPDSSKKSLYKRMSIVMHAIIFLYATAFWIQIGVMPFLSRKLGVDMVMFGYLETAFAVMMLLGGPVFGRFGDLFGARNALLVAMMSSFLTYAILTQANSVFVLFLSRLMAFMMHAMHGAQMVMTDVSGVHERADALGKLGVSYGVGMVVGPTLGGFVTTHFSEQVAAGVAAFICVLAMLIVLLFVPASTKTSSKARSKDKFGVDSEGLFSMKAILSLLRIPDVFFLVLLKTVVGIPAGVFHSMFAMINLNRFQLTPETNGHLLSYVGIITMACSHKANPLKKIAKELIMQGVGVGYFSKRFSDGVLLKSSVAMMSLSYLLLIFAVNLPLLCVVLVPMIMAGALLNTVTNSTITKRVPESSTGTSLGLSMATHSVIRTVSPTLGGYMYAWLGYPSFGMLGFCLNGVLAVYLFLSNPFSPPKT